MKIANDKIKIGAAYIRYSSSMQSEGFSAEAQEHQIRDRAARDEIEILYVYSDAAQSAYKRKLRPGIELMINDAKNRKFDYLYVHKIDRLARRIKSAIEIVEELERCSVSLIAVEQNFDLRTPEGKLMFNFLVSLSEFYSDNLSTETRKGKLERSRSGLPNGVVPWGYVSEKIDGKKKAILVPEQGEVIRKIFEMYSTGAYTDGEIADWMNSQQLLTKHERGFSKDTIREMMQNVFYTGNVLYRGSREKFKGTSYRNEEGVLSKGLHQPAVDDDLFRKCQLVRKSKNNSNKSKQITQKVYLLRGIVKCDCCERFLRAQSAHNGARYYRETSRIRGFDDCIVNSEVKKSINAKVVEDQIEKIIELIILPDSWKSEIQKLIDVESQKFEDIEGKKARINKQIIRIMENFEMGFYENKENSYKQKIGILREKLLELQRPTNADIQEAAEIVLSIKGVWAIASDNEKIKMVKMIFKEVGVSIREGKIVWIKPQFGFEKLFSVIPGFVLNENGRFLID